VTDLVPSGERQPGDVETLRDRAASLETELRERYDELTRVTSDLEAFRIRYRREVGTLHEELEELERAVAELELGEIGKLLNGEATAPEPPVSPAAEAAPRLTSDAVRRLFRDVAKAIHPDLASDEGTRDRRHTLMIEANKAYARGDEDRLRWILQAWENSPEAVPGDDPDAARLRIVRRIAQIEDELLACAGRLASLTDSPLWKLKTLVDEAAARGKDLIADQVRRLKRDIVAARNRRDAMQWHP
jgi:hypothetical protein